VAALRIALLTPARWADFVGLFGPRGACAGCWCQFPRLTSPEWKTQGGSNRRAMKRIVDAGDPPARRSATRPIMRRVLRARAGAARG